MDAGAQHNKPSHSPEAWRNGACGRSGDADAGRLGAVGLLPDHHIVLVVGVVGVTQPAVGPELELKELVSELALVPNVVADVELVVLRARRNKTKTRNPLAHPRLPGPEHAHPSPSRSATTDQSWHRRNGRVHVSADGKTDGKTKILCLRGLVSLLASKIFCDQSEIRSLHVSPRSLLKFASHRLRALSLQHGTLCKSFDQTLKCLGLRRGASTGNVKV